ncbi:Phosphatidylinositol-4-phosphate 5-kinase [Penicillium ucsense]|uniref:Phosphatidylinositol-4-phosphate 5-kinase n=1 Tax=Penicillium ucsense TaxID=2839758 RepID=A0A8J8WA73_9EURO|nr:Phosphatidylinositol-4-phosphate 5-kinase [Penicillium ucsense]KAF7738770.1 Phosphatidylinositol-4-phosphate 5-kinase [Penicillium ucsense]
MRKNRRQSALTKSIQTGVLRDPAQQSHKTAWGRLLAFFSLFKIKLVRHEQEFFRTLRRDIWQFDENEYQDSFRTSGGQPSLKTMGDLGYSGSTFFGTFDGRYVIKSIPRHFEYTFFQSDLLEPYYDHMRDHPDSMLVWITDYLIAPYSTLGTVLSWTPAHHIIMENILCGKSDDLAGDKWETYDLKPLEYFYPERDLVPEPLVSEDTLNRLSDHFENKLHLSREDYNTFIQAMKTDTKFLEDANAVDYSMFLVRIPASSKPECLGRKSPWRAGIRSADGKWKYRAVILDFFWAKHKLHAQALSGVVQTFNVVGRKGHMSITTTSTDYREKFLAMVEGMIQIH